MLGAHLTEKNGANSTRCH